MELFSAPAWLVFLSPDHTFGHYVIIMYPATPSITSQQNTPICHCRQQDAIPCTGAPRESMATIVTIIKRNISFPTTEKPLSIVPLCIVFWNRCSFLLRPTPFSKIFHIKIMQFNQMYHLPISFKFLGPDPPYSKNDHFWEKESRNNVIFYKNLCIKNYCQHTKCSHMLTNWE